MGDRFWPATANDLPVLQSWNILSAYRDTMAEELSGPYAANFRWLLYEVDGCLVAYHRSKLMCGWATWSGVHARDRTIDGRRLAVLAQQAFNDLSSLNLTGQLAWTNDANSAKATFLRRLGFEIYPEPVHQFIYHGDSLQRLKELAPDSLDDVWRPAAEDDLHAICSLAEQAGSFAVPERGKVADGLSHWLVIDGPSKLDAAINWWQLGTGVEVHFVFGKATVTGLTEGFSQLLTRFAGGAVERFRLHLDQRFHLDFVRLLTLRPTIFSQTSAVHLLRYPAGNYTA